jgi:hypothetical protein
VQSVVLSKWKLPTQELGVNGVGSFLWCGFQTIELVSALHFYYPGGWYVCAYALLHHDLNGQRFVPAAELPVLSGEGPGGGGWPARSFLPSQSISLDGAASALPADQFAAPHKLSRVRAPSKGNLGANAH